MSRPRSVSLVHRFRTQFVVLTKMMSAVDTVTLSSARCILATAPVTVSFASLCAFIQTQQTKISGKQPYVVISYRITTAVDTEALNNTSALQSLSVPCSELGPSCAVHGRCNSSLCHRQFELKNCKLHVYKLVNLTSVNNLIHFLHIYVQCLKCAPFCNACCLYIHV